ncbi:hsp70 family protein [Planctomicrobium piriforme]|uniref:hsp70 family protein n=1 Tax=Planctomicrobium piriforme TaxID=1576369 RepID=UPI001FE7BCC0|nr:hsp70 family protein [Planctomicrobium piriforme]
MSESLPSRFVVGIDLGTTNSAVCFVDTADPQWSVQTFLVPQLVAPGEIEARETLPSFSYVSAAGEFPSGSLRMPWDAEDRRDFVGVFAREQGKLAPGRVVESAKSWLCHPGVDRTSPLLPWRGTEDVPRRSPVEVSASYLSQIRQAWNHAHPGDLLEQQDVVITLPASFDEVARELTVEAAKRAGIPRVMLIEEPQAAFYSWLHSHADRWQDLVTPGQNILVCDIGGGTSDFTLIRVRAHASQKVQFHRVAVGDHLILGGDNLDLALAHHLEPRLAGGGQLEPRQWGSLVRICRQVKETLLSDDAPETCTVNVPGAGSRLIGGSLRLEVTREEARQVLLEGFFPVVGLDERPRKQSSGFQEFGLPYAPDPAVTKYLASFLANHLQAGLLPGEAGSTKPDVVLFNGGAFLSPLIQQRILEVLGTWFSKENSPWSPQVLENPRYDLAVARGAAYYGMVRRDQGVRIAAGLPRTYYIGVGADGSDSADAMQALCLMPAGTEPGSTVHLPGHTFSLTVAAPVEFPLFHSSLRLADAAGTLIPIEREQLTALPPIRTVLRFGKEKQAATLTVQLHARLTEIGTLQVWCGDVNGSRTWQLQFDIRSATQTDLSGHTGAGEAAGVMDEESVTLVRQLLQDTFGPNGTGRPGGLPKRIGQLLELSREAWPPALLRQIWEMLMELEPGRRKSSEHEARWLNLLGFSLRPGYGLALDDWRVAETWRVLRGKIAHPGPATLTEWWILWRRIAGGLTGGQQQALANPLLTSLREDQRKLRHAGSKGKSSPGADQSESWRLLGSLERLPASWKHELGEMALELMSTTERQSQVPALLWALGRLGAREPLYGPLNEVVESTVAADWAKRIIAHRQPDSQRFLAAMQLSRRTGDRYRDLPEELRQKVANWLSAYGAPDQFITLVSEGGELAGETTALVFGESLPAGLRLRT